MVILYISKTMQYDLHKFAYTTSDSFTEHLHSAILSNRFKVADILTGINSVLGIMCASCECMHLQCICIPTAKSKSAHVVSRQLRTVQKQKVKCLSEIIIAASSSLK